MTTEKALLGMALFWEQQMSANGQVACGSCHTFDTGGVDPRAATHPGYDGVFGTADDVAGSPGVPLRNTSGRLVGSQYGLAAQVTSRKAPSILNVAYQDRLFYDGRARDGDFRDPLTNQVMATGATALENLVLQPPVNPTEMGQPGYTWQQVVDKLTNARPLLLADQIPARLQFFIGSSSYPQLFQRAFGTPDVTPTRVAFAIATYMRTLVADQSPFDFVIGGSGTLTPAETRGRQLFEQAAQGPAGMSASCVQCHGDVSATSHQRGPSAIATTVYGQQPSGNFHNVGIRPIQEDPGSGAVTNNPGDAGRFKVPLLRNVALHGEWGHTGQFASLADVIEFYDRGGDFHVQQAPEIRPRGMTAQQKADLEAFLLTLTDPRVAAGVAPFDSPVLAGAHRPTTVGTASPGTNGALPVMVAQDPTILGNTQVAMGVDDVRPNSLTALLWSHDPGPAGGTNLFGPTLHVGLTNAELVVTGFSQTGPTGKGFASASFAIPANPVLGGVVAYSQWLIMDPQAPGGVAASAAVRMTIE